MENDDGKFSIGYGKPPPQHRFQKGQSGNPLGRPPGARNMSTIMQRALNERVTINEEGKRRKITKREAMAKQLANKGASGDHKAMQVLLNYETLLESRAERSDTQTDTTLDADDIEVVKGILERFNSQKRGGGGEEN